MDFTRRNKEIYLEDEIYRYRQTNKKISNMSLKRIKKLGIPPGYDTIWLSGDPNENIQVIALDSKGRKQYFYHKNWTEQRHHEKFERMYKFLKKLPLLLKKVEADSNLRGFKKDKMIAFMIKIMNESYIRIGNKKYYDQNESFGLTTLKREHLKFKNGKLLLLFHGKHNVRQEIEIKEENTVRFLNRLYKLNFDWIMKYKNADGLYYRVSAQDVNNYIHDVIGSDFTCKDFRTHGANKIFLESLKSFSSPNSIKEMKQNISKALNCTAEKLGNNKATSKKSYVMEYIINEYQNDCKLVLKGSLLKLLKKASIKKL